MSAAISYLTASTWDHTIWDHLRELQENDPVHWSEPDNVWVVTRYEDVVAVSKNQNLIKSNFSKFEISLNFANSEFQYFCFEHKFVQNLFNFF